MNGLAAEERQVMEQRYAHLSPEQRALAAGTDTAGGFTIPDEAQQQVEVALARFGGIRAAKTTKITTSTGADLPFPTSNDTSNKGARIGENKTVPQQDIEFGQKVLKAYDYTSKLILVSYRLLQDSAVDIVSFLSQRLAERLGRIENEEDTVGTGASMPMGIVTSATAGKVGAATGAITFDEVYDLLYSVDEDYSESGELMFSRDTLKILKKLKDGQGRYLWQSGVAVKEPDTIDRYPYVLNRDVPNMGAGARSMLFGYMPAFYLRDVKGIQMIQLRERFADSLQVGFMAFMRHDAGLIDAGTHPIKYFQNAAA
jgi:HK97 family phage major capsid protein